MALRYSRPRFLYLCLSLAIAIEGSRSSTQEPEPRSRHLYAGHHLASKQVAARLVLKLRPSSVLMSIELRRLNDGSLVFVFLGSYLTPCSAFSVTLTTGAFDSCRLRWFATCSCKPIARGRPLISYAAWLRHTDVVQQTKQLLVTRTCLPSNRHEHKSPDEAGHIPSPPSNLPQNRSPDGCSGDKADEPTYYTLVFFGCGCKIKKRCLKEENPKAT